MNNKEQLIDFLCKQGKGDYTWYDLACKFNIRPEGTKAQRKKAANDIWRSYKKKLLPGIHNETTEVYFDSNWVDFKYNEPTVVTIEEYQPTIPFKEDGMYIVLGCVHAPFVNLDFWNQLLRLANNYKDKIKGLVLAGDFLDLNSLSSHDRGKVTPIPRINLGWEYREASKYLDSIENVLNTDIYKGYIFGNHENRYQRYLSNVDNNKLGTGLKSPIEGLDLIGRGYEVFEDWKLDKINIGDLAIYHGESCSKYAAAKELEVEKQSVLFFHTHRVQSFLENNYHAYNGGSMADFNSPVFNYASKKMKYTWKNAFAIVNLHKGKTTVETVNWNQDHFIYGGNVYT